MTRRNSTSRRVQTFSSLSCRSADRAATDMAALPRARSCAEGTSAMVALAAWARHLGRLLVRLHGRLLKDQEDGDSEPGDTVELTGTEINRAACVRSSDAARPKWYRLLELQQFKSSGSPASSRSQHPYGDQIRASD